MGQGCPGQFFRHSPCLLEKVIYYCYSYFLQDVQINFMYLQGEQTSILPLAPLLIFTELPVALHNTQYTIALLAFPKGRYKMRRQ